MDYLYMKTLRPDFTDKEISDFLAAPEPQDIVPEIFKDAVKFRNVIFIDITRIPNGMSKREYAALLSSCKAEINKLKLEIREWKNKQKYTLFMEMQMEDLITRENNIKKRLIAFGKPYDGSHLNQAKQVPIDTLIEIHGGFAKCPLHPETRPSMKYYPGENRWHCFSCQTGGDSVDLAMAINSITMPEAIKLLTRS